MLPFHGAKLTQHLLHWNNLLVQGRNVVLQVDSLAGVADTIQETGKGKPVAWINKDLKTYTTRPGIPQLLGFGFAAGNETRSFPSPGGACLETLSSIKTTHRRMIKQNPYWWIHKTCKTTKLWTCIVQNMLPRWVDLHVCPFICAWPYKLTTPKLNNQESASSVSSSSLVLSAFLWAVLSSVTT